MSSILTSSFEKNLERTSASTRRSTHNPDAATSFARLLGDLEKQLTESVKVQANPSQCSAGESGLSSAGDMGHLSNLTLGEQNEIARADISIAGEPQRLATPSIAPPDAISSPVVLLPPLNEPKLQPVSRFVPNSDGSEISAVDKTTPTIPEVISARTITVSPKTLPPATTDTRNKLEELRSIIRNASLNQGIDPDLSFAVAKAESSLKVYAISEDGHGSKGLFQLLDTTAREMMVRTGKAGQKYDPFDAKQNSELGNAYLRRLHDLFGKESNLGWNLKTVAASSAGDLEKLAVAAFNAGEGRVARAQSRARAAGKDPGEFEAIRAYLPASTQQYVQRVLNYRDEIVASATPSASHTETV